jgi:hypothetical protein
MKEEREQHLSDRLKEEVPRFVEQQFGHIEQVRPKKPSFLFVVLLAGGVLIVLFILAIIVLYLGGSNLRGHSFRKHPTSQLVLPAPTPPADTSVQLA